MIIGVDAKSLEGNRTGVGRYLKNVLAEIADSMAADPAYAAWHFILYFQTAVPELDFLRNSPFFSMRVLGIASNFRFIHQGLTKAAQADKIDVLFAPEYVLPLGYRGKSVLVLHDIFYEAYPDKFNWISPLHRITLKWLSRLSSRRATCIITPSLFSKQEVERLYGIPEQRITVTPLAVDAALEKPVSEQDITTFKKSLGITGSFFFYAGSLFNRRYPREMLEGFGIFAREAREKGWQFLVVGKNHTNPPIAVAPIARHINEQLGYEAIILRDYFADAEMRTAYAAAYAFIYISFYEGFGLPPLEAMAKGTPAISTPLGSLAEVVGEASLMVQHPDDPADIAAAFRHMSDPTVRAEFSRLGRKRAAQFSWRRTAEKTLQVFQQLA